MPFPIGGTLQVGLSIPALYRRHSVHLRQRNPEGARVGRDRGSPLLPIGRVLQVGPSGPGALYERHSVPLSQGNPEWVPRDGERAAAQRAQSEAARQPKK